IENGKLYNISNGRVGKVNSCYNHLNNLHEFFLQPYFVVTPAIGMQEEVPLYHFHFIEIIDILSAPTGSLVDVIDVVMAISPCSTIRQRDKSEVVKRVLHMRDMSGFNIYVTLWGKNLDDLCKEFLEILLVPDIPILSIKVGRVIDFNETIVDIVSSSRYSLRMDLKDATCEIIGVTAFDEATENIIGII
ncbi:hypothetical protein KI387_011633, partial [Taxus chinensis]